ncbi:MAG: SsrA-binding protein SmpB [Desulfovibrio sp.]|uniref:SsrA-binding protein SmpB n=1 Tax=Desulfovibrio sp. 7SRBS1 TaxID=3378064 RepID=UPI003B4210B5
MPPKKPHKTVAVNKKARHEYEFLEIFEAGMSLVGTEVKSMRQGKISFKDGHIQFRNNEAWLVGVHIAPYDHSGYSEHDPERPRKLLLHTREITQLSAKVDQKGLAVIPTKIYLVHGRFKVEIALARGKKTYDRKQELKQRDIDRETKRQMVNF